MKPEPNHALDKFRCNHPTRGDSPPGVNWGLFFVDGLAVVSSGTPQSEEPPWEHVSVSHPRRTPTWEEMCRIKRMFWTDQETVLQFHPRRDQYVNIHPYCLHMWRNVNLDIPLPSGKLI